MTNSEDLVWSLNLVSGVVAPIARHVFEHPTFAPNQVEVEPYTQSYENWTAKTKDEFHAWKSAAEERRAPEIEADPEIASPVIAPAEDVPAPADQGVLNIFEQPATSTSVPSVFGPQ